MRWPWTRGRHARGKFRRPGPATGVPATEARDTQRQLHDRMAEADERLKETISTWPKVTGQSLRLARLNRENHLSGLIDQALRSGPS